MHIASRPPCTRLARTRKQLRKANAGDFDRFDKASTTAQTLSIGAGTNQLLGFSQPLTSTKGTKILSTSSQQVNYTLEEH
jgi:hypothetical protein